MSLPNIKSPCERGFFFSFNYNILFYIGASPIKHIEYEINLIACYTFSFDSFFL
jgi:hypothetical protein